MKQLFVLLVVSLYSLISFGQPIERQGYIVRRKGDTVSGTLSSRNWVETPRFFYFKSPAEPGHTVRINPRDVVQVVVEGKEKYESASWGTGTEFLQLVVEGGRLSLYKLNWGEGNTFFVSDPGGINLVRLQGATRVYSRPFRANVFEFQVQLYRSLETDARAASMLLPKLSECVYDENSLTDAVLTVNDYFDRGAVDLTVSKEPTWNIFFGGGAVRQWVTVSGDGATLGKMKFNNPLFPIFGVGVRWQNRYKAPRWAGCFSFQYLSGDMEGVGTTDRFAGVDSSVFSFRQRSYVGNLCVEFRLFPMKKPGRFFELKAGLNLAGFVSSFPRQYFQQYYKGGSLPGGSNSSMPLLWEWGGYVAPKLCFSFPCVGIDINAFYHFPSLLATDQDYNYSMNQAFGGIMVAYHFNPFGGK